MLFKSHDFLIAYRYTFNACLLYAWHDSSLSGWYDCTHFADEKQSQKWMLTVMVIIITYRTVTLLLVFLQTVVIYFSLHTCEKITTVIFVLVLQLRTTCIKLRILSNINQIIKIRTMMTFSSPYLTHDQLNYFTINNI